MAITGDRLLQYILDLEPQTVTIPSKMACQNDWKFSPMNKINVFNQWIKIVSGIANLSRKNSVNKKRN